jgi:hypothetical protein
MTHWFLSQKELTTEVKTGLEKIVAEDVRVANGGVGMSSTLRGGGGKSTEAKEVELESGRRSAKGSRRRVAGQDCRHIPEARWCLE